MNAFEIAFVIFETGIVLTLTVLSVVCIIKTIAVAKEYKQCKIEVEKAAKELAESIDKFVKMKGGSK